MPRVITHRFNIDKGPSGLLHNCYSRRSALLLRALFLVCAWCGALGSPQAQAQTAPPNVQFTNKAVDTGHRENLRVNRLCCEKYFKARRGR